MDAIKLACHGWMDAGRGQETPESETEAFSEVHQACEPSSCRFTPNLSLFRVGREALQGDPAVGLCWS